MREISVVPVVPRLWELSFTLRPGPDGEVLRAACGETPAVTFVREGGTLRAEVHTRWDRTTARFGERPGFTFALAAPRSSGRFSLAWREASLRLTADGVLCDEDWPLGEPPPGPWTLSAADGAEGAALTDAPAEPEAPETVFEGPFQFYRHPGHNTAVGDCMPFERDGRWCLYYLLDRRGHHSKCGLGAHQWAQVSTADLKRWTLHPMAVGITEQCEGSICTGSLIQKDGKTWAFYAVRMSDGSPARLTYAVSADGVHFEKSGVSFSLTAPYEPVSARDPKVFFGPDGRWHMLVTTSLADAGPYGGCLAHLTSEDLTEWTQHEPFLVPGYADQPECSDWFEWDGLYYLVFSNFATARYRISRGPFGPWERPENDLLDAPEIQVPKTAAFGKRRFCCGFLAPRPRRYAGNAVTHELFRRADGTLGVRQAEELLPAPRETLRPAAAVLSAPEGLACADLPEPGSRFRLRATLAPSGRGAVFGLTLLADPADGGVYRIEIDPAAGTAEIVRPRESFEGAGGRSLLRGLRADGGLPVDLLVSGDILDLMIGDGRCMTVRLERPAGSGARLSLYVRCGGLEASDCVLSKF